MAPDTEINSGLNIEAIRISAANKIRNVNEQLKAFDQLINKPEYLMYSARIIPELAAQKLPKELDEIDTVWLSCDQSSQIRMSPFRGCLQDAAC